MLPRKNARLAARIGALALHSSRSGIEITASARRAFLASFERAVDPDALLDVAERKRRASFALRAHMARLALDRANARRSTSNLVKNAEAARLAPSGLRNEVADVVGRPSPES